MNRLTPLESRKAIDLYKECYKKSFTLEAKNETRKKMVARALIITGLFAATAAIAVGVMLPGIGLFVAPPLFLLGIIISTAGFVKNKNIGRDSDYYEKAAESITIDLMKFSTDQEVPLGPNNIFTVLKDLKKSQSRAALKKQENMFRTMLRNTKPSQPSPEFYKPSLEFYLPLLR